LLNSFFGLVERYAGFKGVYRLSVPINHNSPVMRFLSDDKFSIRSHGLRDDRIEIVFIKNLMLDFGGDTRNWLSFCHWYIKLSFGNIATIEDIPLSNRYSSPYSIKFSIKSNNIDAYEIPITAISISKSAIPELSKISIDHKRHTIFMIESAANLELPEIFNDIDQINAGSLVSALEKVKKSYLEHIYSASTLAEETKDSFIKKWFPLKTGHIPLKLSKVGAIVEIDRKTYEVLINKRLKNNKHNILFFNTASFGEKMSEGDILFFFIWDNFTNDSEDSSPGVLCAYGTIDRIEPLNITEIQKPENWKKEGAKGESYSSQAIFREPFLNQYFQDEVIGFYLSNINYVTLDDKPETIDGISYQEIIDILYTYFNRKPDYDKDKFEFLQQLFPVWGIQNTYLTQKLVNELVGKFSKIDPQPKKWEVQNMTTKTKNDPVKTFICYAHEDIEYRKKLQKFLDPIIGDHFIQLWNDDEIDLGDNWKDSIGKALNESEMGIILISIDFLNSKFINSVELPELLRKRKEEGLRLVPILIGHCPWKNYQALAELQVFSTDKPVDDYIRENRGNEIWNNFAEMIKKLAQKLRTA